MAQDHYVAQTFLRHFTDADGKLHAYSKIDGKYFTPGANGVCKEWNGDFNPAISGMPEMLGEYRKLFEPDWNAVVEELNKQNGSRDVRLMVALCFANMVTCVPAWRRVSAEIWENMRVSELRFRHLINEQRGIKDELLAEGVAMLNEGKIVIEADPNGIKAKLTGALVGYACLAYHSNWLFFENKTDIPFITADNPVALNLSDVIGQPMTRFMPITPQLGLFMKLDAWDRKKRRFPKEKSEVERLLQEEPLGTVRGCHPSPSDVRALNRRIVRCAENFVFSNRKDNGIEGLVEKYSKYRIEADSQDFRESDGGFVHGFIIRVRPRTDL